MGRPRSKPMSGNRATSLDYMNKIKEINPAKNRNNHPFLPLHARLAVKKLKRQEEQLKQLEGQ